MKCCKIIFFCLAVSAAFSCMKTESAGGTRNDVQSCVSHFSFSVRGFAAETKSILPESEIEGRITDLTLASYSVSGQLIDCAYFDAVDGEINLYVDARARTKVYALANVGDFSSEFPDRECDVDKIEFRVRPYDEIALAGMPMCGTVTVSPEDIAEVNVRLEYLFSKVSVRILHDGLAGATEGSVYAYNLRNDSIYIRQANTRLVPFSSEGSRALSREDAVALSDYNPDLDDRNAYQGSLEPWQIGPGVGFFQDTTIVFYVPENMQGRLLPDNSGPDGKNPEGLDLAGGPLPYKDICTYVEFNASRVKTDGYGGSLSYRFYLGEDATSDFSLRRNTEYMLSLHLTEKGLFVDDWKASHGDDWSDDRCLFFREDPYHVYTGDETDIVVHFHKYGVLEGSSAGDYRKDWLFEYVPEDAEEAGLTIDPDAFVMGTGKNGYSDFIMKVSAAEDAVDGAVVPVGIRSWDGSIVQTSSIEVIRLDDLSAEWESFPEYVSQYGVLNVSGAPSDRLPVNLTSTDESVLRCTRVDDDTFRVVALKEGDVSLAVSNSSGSQKMTLPMHVKSPLLRIINHPDEINPDGTSCPVSCEFLTDEGTVLSGYDESVFNSVLRMSLTDGNIALMGPQGNYSIAITNLGGLVPGTVRELRYSVPGCPGAGQVTAKVLITDPFKDVVPVDFGAVDDYSLIRSLGTYSPVYKSFADRIERTADYVFPVARVNADISRISASAVPEWEGGYSGACGAYSVTYAEDRTSYPSGAAVELKLLNTDASTSHSVGAHDVCLHVRNAYSGQDIVCVCGSVDVYVHNVLGATAYISSGQASYAPTGGKTFAQVYNELAGRTLYYQYSTGEIYYMDVYVDFLASVKGVLVWNRMREYASQRVNIYDALSFLQPDVTDGSTDPNLRHLYSVNSGAGERSVICGEDSGVRKGLGNMLYRALRLEVSSASPSDPVLKEWFLGYTGLGTVRSQFAPAYSVCDVRSGEYVPHTSPYYFTPSSMPDCVDAEGRGYHVIHFLEDVIPSSNGWTNLMD